MSMKFDSFPDADDFAAEGVPLTAEQEKAFDPFHTEFIWYQPPLASEVNHTTGGQEWCITGHDMQVLSMTVPANKTIVTEVGTFMYMAPGMETEVDCTLCGCHDGFGATISRICGGESCVKLLLRNKSGEQGYVGLTPNFPAKVS